MSLLDRAVRTVNRLLSQNFGPLSTAAYHVAHAYTKSYNNLNYDMKTNGEYHLLDRLARFETKTIFDVGANKGEYAKACLARFEDAELHAFELVPETYAKFVANVRSDRVVANNFGLSDTPGSVEINVNPRKDGLSSLIEGTAINKGTWTKRSVEVVRGDDYCAERVITQIDFLKVDVEGAEHLVLEGFSRMLTEGRISVIQFEYGMINIYSKFLLLDFWRVLTGHGFVLGPIMPRGAAFRSYDARDENFQGPPNFVAVHASKPEIIQAVRLR
ncbi:FkbM family methyltransferase [Methylobacterium sp. M6A4_1b]